MLIDAHQHFWTLARGDYGWLTPALAPIYRDFGPEDLAPLMASSGFARSILVQAAPSVAETQFMLAIAARHATVAGVVGWVDFDADEAQRTIATLAGDPLLVGLRPMIHDLPDPAWMVQPHLAPAFEAMRQHGLVFDALVRPVHLPPLLSLARRYPDLPIVIDHAAKPDIANGVFEPWRADMAALAALPNVSVKLSGLATEAGKDWRGDDLKPVVDHLLAEFGPQRMMFGSDWPVATLAIGYGEWFDLARRLISGCSAAEQAAIFGENAQRVYLSRRGRR